MKTAATPAPHAANQWEILLPNALDHGFDYLAPADMALIPGSFVTVPFGRSESLGVVWQHGTANVPPGKIKHIARHLTQFPPLSEAMRQFIDWASWYNCAPSGGMLKMTLPLATIASEARIKATAFATRLATESLNLAPLSGMQAEAAAALTAKLNAGFSVTLLDGVTGSGKTEVYFDTIAHALKADSEGQILVLLPEIALSVQFLERFEKRFGFAPAVWNSEITPARKRATWQAIATGETRIVVGARSALFLPYKHLRLIVADEEHDASYKQTEGLIYHARDMAVARARFEKIPIILVSATPSLESHYNARQHKYTELSLPARHGAAQMPDIELIDMRQTPMDRDTFISPPLRQALAESLASGHQSLLFLNRRGYAPLLLCRACGHRFQCAACSAWLVLHKRKKGDILCCHHCDHREPVPPACPSCHAEDSFHACGPGIERLQEEVADFLPQARIGVLASDATSSLSDIAGTINAMSEGAIDILIGTQMIAKGHHFADLATVGIVDADLGLGGGDLRASEHTYQLLHQLSGRAGRESVHGRVYLQSYLPEHPVMQALVSGDRDRFLAAELAAREKAGMPPFTRLAALIVDGEKEEQVIRAANHLASTAPRLQNLEILGPAPAPLSLLRGRFRYRLLARSPRNVNLPDIMKHWVASQTPPSSVRIKTDIDPVSFL